MAKAMLIESIFSIASFALSLTGIILRLTLKERGKFIFEYESWCILAEAGYYLIQSIFCVINTITATTDSCLQNFIKFTLSKLLFPPILACPFIFFLGSNVKWFKFYTETKKEYMSNLINHLIAPACVLLDSILFKRKYTKSNLFNILIITGIYIAYSILCLPFQTNETYLFIDKGKGCMISVMIVFYCIGIIMHFTYIVITRIRNYGSKDD